MAWKPPMAAVSKPCWQLARAMQKQIRMHFQFCTRWLLRSILMDIGQ